MNTRLYLLVDLIRGSYWVLWIAFDVLVLFQVYYYYRDLAVGVGLLAVFFASTYLEYKLYEKLVEGLERRLQ